MKEAIFLFMFSGTQKRARLGYTRNGNNASEGRMRVGV
jgi:hypothetical protein